MQTFTKLYELLIRASDGLRSPFLLTVRLYWGWQFAQAGWGKLGNIGRVTHFFADLGIPAPAFNARFVSGLELVGGILLVLGLGSRMIALLLAIDMAVAYLTAEHQALVQIFSDPDKFIAATPFTFLLASLIILIFGSGKFSLDALFAGKPDAAKYTTFDKPPR